MIHGGLSNWWETNGGHGHGGPFELSAVAAVNSAALVAERGPDLPAPPEISQGFLFPRGWPGYSGKVSEASRKKGEKIIALATDRIVQLVKRWMANPEAPGAW